MAERWGIERRMLVDALDGPVHHAYGLLPNMTYVVSPPGRVSFKADWTEARVLGMVLDHLVHERNGRRAGRRLAPFRVEWAPSRIADRPPFMEGLLAAGPRAVEEFIAATRQSMGEAAARPLAEWWSSRRT